MIETNIRIVKPGEKLCIIARIAKIKGQEFSPDLLEKACSALGTHHRLAAVPYVSSGEPKLLVLTSDVIPSVTLEDLDWRLDIDDGRHELQLKYAEASLVCVAI